jgi:Ca-activated chloride channel family protein
MVDVSLRFGVLCRFTAFVAVDSRVVTSGESPHQVIQPVELPGGWQYGAAPVAENAAFIRPMMAPAPSGPPQFAGGMPSPPPRPASAMPPASGGGMPGGRSRSFLRGRMPFPDAAAPVPPQVDQLADARLQVAEEVTLLTARAGEPEPVRWELLSDLRTRLEGLLSQLRLLGISDEGFAALIELHAELAVVDDRAQRSHLAGLWERTVRTLSEFSTGSSSWSTDEPPARAFWKKRP